MIRDKSRENIRARSAMRLITGSFSEQRHKVTGPLRRGVFVMPATITSLGLLAGFYSLISSINAHFEVAAVMILIAFICDGLDGRVARVSRTSSQFGIEYDSLSDVVAFGCAPAALTYTWALKPLGAIAIAISGLYVVCAALRLARFNVQTGSVDKRRFVGLPVPGAAAMIAGTVLAYSYFELNSPLTLCTFAAPATLALAGLMVSRVPYPSFKGIDLQKHSRVELLLGGLLVIAAMLLAMPQFTTFALATSYVLSGPFLMARGERIARVAPPGTRRASNGAEGGEQPGNRLEPPAKAQ
ncbi:MAG TPA: CDP-diacylglycerol--serine O-phosphatidyltransferase [Candidatus Binataceae bacterium]|nr:CDP-diacylglycerol--serine O-phosphatidyltransferase [Candidatus Binataceae bacterium]